MPDLDDAVFAVPHVMNYQAELEEREQVHGIVSEEELERLLNDIEKTSGSFYPGAGRLSLHTRERRA